MQCIEHFMVAILCSDRLVQARSVACAAWCFAVNINITLAMWGWVGSEPDHGILQSTQIPCSRKVLTPTT
jgi:hypothetical protein